MVKRLSIRDLRHVSKTQRDILFQNNRKQELPFNAYKTRYCFLISNVILEKVNVSNDQEQVQSEPKIRP